MSTTTKPIKGKIARIVTRRNVVINRGAQDGVTKGMRFSVVLKVGKIEDPDDPTNTMNNLSFVKAKLRVSAVYDRMSYCATIGTPKNPLPFFGRSSPLKETPSYEYPPIGDKEMVSEDAWKLRRGDAVKQIVEDDDKE